MRTIYSFPTHLLRIMLRICYAYDTHYKSPILISYASGTHPISKRYSFPTHPVLISFAYCSHLVRITYTSCLNCLRIQYASRFASGVHFLRILYASGSHFLLIWFESGTHPILGCRIKSSPAESFKFRRLSAIYSVHCFDLKDAYTGQANIIARPGLMR